MKRHNISIETKPGRAPTPVRSRFTCSCGLASGWADPRTAHDIADLHVASQRGGRQ